MALRDTIERSFAAVMAKDLDAVLSFFAEDSVLIDPHYPSPRMVGKAAIGDGLTWAFSNMEQMGFTIVHYFAGEDGKSAVVEVDTAHVLRGGMKLNFPQVFVIETRDGLITRLQAYEPYGPPGIGGLMLGLTRLMRKLTGKK